MKKSNQTFTTGVWNVKKGKEKEFIKEWAEFAEWSNNIDNVSARLFQDDETPTRFVSIGTWNDDGTIQKWRERSEYKDSLSRITNLLTEPAKPQKMKEVANVGEYSLV